MEPTIDQVLILMRHAARAGSQDGLSPEGHKQAEGLPKLLELKILKHFRRPASAFQLCSSPKLRTQQTLRFVRDSLQTPVQVLSDLDERTGDETQSAMEKRVKFQLNKWTADASDEEKLSPKDFSPKKLSVTLGCSHLDWLEAAGLFIDSDELELQRAEPWAPLSMKIYGFQNGIWRRFA
ncbi:MAG: histidine phosphatase family protein [Bdellovibrionales bacterium]|nr:histidine phosphatase family protein [Bdellovibrionales bacterium]